MNTKIKRVYVAGAITPQTKIGNPSADFLNNIRRGVQWCQKVFHAGFIPYCAFFDFINWFVVRDGETVTDEMVQAISIGWLEVSDALLIIPNESGYNTWQDSTGTNKEIHRAQALDIPVFHSLEELIEYNNLE